MQTDGAQAIYARWYTNYMQQENGKKIHKDLFDKRIESPEGKRLIQRAIFMDWKAYLFFGLLTVFVLYLLIIVPPHKVIKMWLAYRSQ